MNNTKMLEKINKIIAVACNESDDYKHDFELFRKYPNEDFSNSDFLSAQLETLRREIVSEIYIEEAKKAGSGNRRKAVEKFIKNTQNENHKGVFYICGEQYLVNSYTGFKLYKPFEGLPESENPFEQIKKIMDNDATTNNLPLALPDITTLKAYIKEQKANLNRKEYKYISYDFGEGLPLVNANYLLDVYNILGVENLEAYIDGKPLHAIYFKNENGEAVLLPIARREKHGY